MRKIKYITIIIASFTFLFFSCEDFLEKEPIGKETSGNFFAAGDNAEYAINACYDALTWDEGAPVSIGHTYEFMAGDILSDDAEKGSTESDFPALIRMKQWEMLTEDFNGFWNRDYAILYRVNNVLFNLPNVELESKEMKKSILGEAYFLRAYAHFYQLRIYGKAPVFTQPVKTNDFGKVKAADFDEMFNLIEVDLDSAIALLPTKSEYESLPYNTGTLGRATKGAAQAYKARVVMYHIGLLGESAGATWQHVYDLCKEVINSGEYSLTPNYAEIFEYEGENNQESIFEIQFKSNGIGYNPNGSTSHIKASTSSTVMQGNRNLGGWGFNTPTQDLYDTYGDQDPRRESSIIKDGDYVHGVLHEISADHTRTGYLNRKAQLDPRLKGSGGDKDSGHNIRIIRYADVLLMAAEAGYHLGKEGEARDMVNLIRERARVSTFPKGFTEGKNDYEPTGYTDNIADITSTGDNLLKDIYKERRLEFAMESIRFWDLVRTNRYMDMLSQKYSETIKDKSLSHSFITSAGTAVPVFPIPKSEVDSWLFDQNPGY